jgi:hypothetical protein
MRAWPLLAAAVILTAGLAALPSTAHAEKTYAPGPPDRYIVSGYKIRTTDVHSSQRPWRTKVAPRVDTGTHDTNGVRMFKHVDGKTYDHPVGQIQYALYNIAAYRKTLDKFYLNRAIANAERLLDNKHELRGGWWYPYPFDWALSPTNHPGVAYQAPWYSGMAQGEALSLFSQLSILGGVNTADRARYRHAATMTFETFKVTNTARPWHVNADSAQQLWIQEYPAGPGGKSDYTYNGMMFAMLGLWDYHLITRDPLAAKLWDGTLTTISRRFTQLRNVGTHSDYCRTHAPAPHKTYHRVHIELLTQLTWLSGNSRFGSYAALLRQDAPI